MADQTTPNQDPNAGQAPAPEAEHKPATPAPDAAADGIDALPDWAKKEIKDLRREAAERRRATQAAEEAAKKAADQKLADDQKWKELADQREAEIASLKTSAEKYAALAATVTAAMEAEIAAWPEEIKALKPAGADVDQLAAWMQQARPIVVKLQGAQQAPAPRPGAAPAPKPAGTAPDKAAQEAIAKFRQDIRNL